MSYGSFCPRLSWQVRCLGTVNSYFLLPLSPVPAEGVREWVSCKVAGYRHGWYGVGVLHFQVFRSCYLADEWSGTRLSEGQLPPFGSYSYMVVERSGAQCQLAILLVRINCVD